MEQYQMFELSFPGKEPDGSMAQVDLTADFTCQDTTVSVAGFYAGGGIYKVRFLPCRQGMWNWKVRGVIEAEGSEYCAPGKGHGPVRAEDTHFRYEDGAPYWPIGTTIYALAHQPDERIAQTMRTLERACFNKVRLCLFPKWMAYNHDEPALFPFEKTPDGVWDVHHPCFAFWDSFERTLFQLEERGIQADLILFHPYDHWGFSALGREADLAYVDYLLRRFSAMPHLWWSLANEYDMMHRHTMEDWYALEEFVDRHDPYRHLLSNHNWLTYWDFARPRTTHVCLQTRDVYKVDQWVRQYQKPVVIDECCYEGTIPESWGNISAFEMVHRFWCVTAKGGFCTHGETYWAEDEVLWWAKGGRLQGESPSRLAFLAGILRELPGPLTPELPRAVRIDPNAGAEQGKEPSPEEVEFHVYLRSVTDRLDPAHRELMAMYNADYESRCGDLAYLTYYGRQRPAFDTLRLSPDHRYRVEVIDVWDMTRTVISDNASGAVRVTLPGKEGIAVLALARKEL